MQELINLFPQFLGESIVTVAEGQESEVITHPALASVKFKLKVEKVELEC